MNASYNPEKHHRRSIRLCSYDYSRAGAYFITVCTRNRECLLGDVVEGRMYLNEVGRLAQAAWEELPLHYPHVDLDAWKIMPNHVHGIVVLTAEGVESHEGAGLGQVSNCPYQIPMPMPVRSVMGCLRLSGPSKHSLPGASTPFSAPLVHRSGSAITTNTLSGTSPR